MFRLISKLISMSRLLTDVADLAGYAEPVTVQINLDTLNIAGEQIFLKMNKSYDHNPNQHTGGENVLSNYILSLTLGMQLSGAQHA